MVTRSCGYCFGQHKYHDHHCRKFYSAALTKRMPYSRVWSLSCSHFGVSAGGLGVNTISALWRGCISSVASRLSSSVCSVHYPVVAALWEDSVISPCALMACSQPGTLQGPPPQASGNSCLCGTLLSAALSHISSHCRYSGL